MPLKTLPQAITFQRGAICTDATMYSVTPEGRKKVQVIRHGIRGTQNTPSEDTSSIVNIQVTESAKTDSSASGLEVEFSYRPIPIDKLLDTVNAKDAKVKVATKDAINSFLKDAKTSNGLQEICNRIARNLFKGDWLWRNQILATTTTVTVEYNNQEFQENANNVPTTYTNYTKNELSIGAAIREGYLGNSKGSLKITAKLDFGLTGAIEVFPSQNYLGAAKTDGFARSLYKLNTKIEKHGELDGVVETGDAMIRDQKITNAIKSFDTWYPAYATTNTPLPIEPNGASLKDLEQYRTIKGGKSLFVLLKELPELDVNTNDGMFVLANFIVRGGVFTGDKAK